MGGKKLAETKKRLQSCRTPTAGAERLHTLKAGVERIGLRAKREARRRRGAPTPLCFL